MQCGYKPPGFARLLQNGLGGFGCTVNGVNVKTGHGLLLKKM
jgi:hypothetical protein